MKKLKKKTLAYYVLIISIISQLYIYIKFHKLLRLTIFSNTYLGISLSAELIFFFIIFFAQRWFKTHYFKYFFSLFLTIQITNTFISLVFFILDLISFGIYSVNLFLSKLHKELIHPKYIDLIPIYFAKLSFGIFLFAIVTLLIGIIYGVSNFKIVRKKLKINIPLELNGLKIGHISDIHCGSIMHKTLKKGINLLLNEKPDIIFFTGDMIDFHVDEIAPYMSLLKTIKAPLGVYAILGNHDYGIYFGESIANINENIDHLKEVYKKLNWKLLMDESKIVKYNGKEFSIIGVQNWSLHSFERHGNLEKAYKSSRKFDFKILLSHDPSHWKGEVVKHYKDINITLSGHTHGSQIGIFTKKFKWSPVQYKYKEWAGHYKHNNQHLYVNKGFGSTHYQGRVGIRPEITIIELETL